jgi:hypothetical protein
MTMDATIAEAGSLPPIIKTLCRVINLAFLWHILSNLFEKSINSFYLVNCQRNFAVFFFFKGLKNNLALQ